jgi:hypothetical protein
MSSSGSLVDAIVDGVANPVSEASAAPLDVATEPCNKTGTVNGSSFVYAVHEYPGKTVQDLSALRVVSHFVSGPQRPTIAGVAFEQQAGVPFLRDGFAAAFCGASGAPTYDSVTFILP